MAIQLAIDDALINEACVLGHFKNKEDAVINALREFINRRKQQMTLQKSNRVIFGVMEGQFSIPANFDDPLPQDIEDDFYLATL
ncbi:MAG: type II toxin-antitoxin system VapB family antitoxin [Candidatus Omnitrophica bacterium]|nr:type II toxin-antitoxin system VapB family antitoxin [Candidatus Omnitrophota bacterium]MDD5551150.1 type II toxin-antitoxin system VapB family antitoxin [Candidatus Omnitrophota bacterium]